MKPGLAAAAIVLLSAGCAGRHAGPRTSAADYRADLAAPTDEEAERAYKDFLYRETCRGVKQCGDLWRRQPAVAQVSSVECLAPRRAGRVRCDFAAHERTSLPYTGPLEGNPTGTAVTVHLCKGLFQKRGNRWRMLSVIGKCYPRK